MSLLSQISTERKPWEQGWSSSFKRSNFLLRSDPLPQYVCRATEELVPKISMRFIQPHHLRNVIVDTINDAETYVQ